MKRISIIIFVLALVVFSVGCHSMHMASKVHTGKVDIDDIWAAAAADDNDMQKVMW